MARLLRIGVGALVATGLPVILLWATSPDPTGNVASFEEAGLNPAIASLDKAVTLAQVPGSGGRSVTLLVIGMSGEEIEAVDLSRASRSKSADPFVVLAEFGQARLGMLAANRDLVESYTIGDLLAGDQLPRTCGGGIERRCVPVSQVADRPY